MLHAIPVNLRYFFEHLMKILTERGNSLFFVFLRVACLGLCSAAIPDVPSFLIFPAAIDAANKAAASMN